MTPTYSIEVDHEVHKFIHAKITTPITMIEDDFNQYALPCMSRAFKSTEEIVREFSSLKESGVHIFFLGIYRYVYVDQEYALTDRFVARYATFNPETKEVNQQHCVVDASIN